ncbi:hypothetical protein [Acidovorax delafieldii]|uniref:hypothetical protein n=1 Tax=Acidovorax delafieldii TaxID=47920 RepID=UPI00286CAAD3|nr:hypothetical protein [Acidovorax delafieldii]
MNSLPPFLKDHALLAAWLAFLHWTAYVPLAWSLIRGQAPFKLLGLTLGLPLGLAVGLLSNFQAFFILVVAAQHFTLPTLICLSVTLSGCMLALLCWCVPRWHEPPPTIPISKAYCSATVWLAALAALAALGLFSAQVFATTPNVFVAWDSVVSWNRWATEWSEQTTPIFTMGYPQLLPTGLASLYSWFGSQKVEPVARWFMLVFPLGTCLLFLDGFHRLKNASFLWGMACWLVMLRFAFGDMADSGYADVPASFFVALAAYLLLLGHLRQIPGELAFLGSALCCAGAVLTKQPGGIAWLLWLILAALHAPMRRSLATPWRFLLGCSLVFVTLAVPWYAYTAWKIRQGTDVTNLGYLVSTIHRDRDALERLMQAFQGPVTNALEGFGSPTVTAAVMTALLLLSLHTRLGHILVLAICLPYTLLWAVLFSYDIRNIMPVIPILCLVLGMGASRTLDLVAQFVRRSEPSATDRTALNDGKGWQLALGLKRGMMTSVVLAVSALSALLPLSIRDIEYLHLRLQRQSLNPALNEALLSYANSPGFNGQVVTTYAGMLVIDELKNHVPSFKTNPNPSPALQQALLTEKSWCEIQPLAPHWSNVRYLLLHKPFMQAVVDQGLRDGTLHMELEMDGVRLVKTQCPA